MGSLFSKAMPNIDKVYKDLLEYVMMFEETSRLSDESFVKDYTGENDWSNDHFLRHARETREKLKIQKKKSRQERREDNDDTEEINEDVTGGNGKEYDVIIDSYTLDRWKDSVGLEASKALFFVNDGNNAAHTRNGRFTISRRSKVSPPWLSFCAPSESREIQNGIRSYLEELRNEFPSDFAGCELEDILTRLTLDDLPTENVQKGIAKFLASAIVNRDLASLRQRFLELHQKTTSGSLELVVGVCHVRMRFNGKGGQYKIVNGPLLEIPVELKKEGTTMSVIPRSDAKVKVNRAVLSVVLDSIGANPEMNEKVHSLSRCMKLESIFPAKPESFLAVAEEVENCHWNALLKRSTDDHVHDPPADVNKLVITNAWCVFCREKKTSVFEEDAFKICEAVKDGTRSKVPGIIAMIKGPPKFIHPRRIVPWTTSEKDVIFPLPTSNAQKKIGHWLFVSNVPVLCVDGPPGTGKTHSIINCAAAAVALGRNTLVTSKNKRALRGFMEKLPRDLQPLCFDFASCAAGDMSKLLENIDVVQGYLKETNEKRQRRHEDIVVCTEQLREKKSELTTLESELISGSKKRRELMQNVRIMRILELALLAADTAKAWLSEKHGDEVTRDDETKNDASKVSVMNRILVALENSVVSDSVRGDTGNIEGNVSESGMGLSQCTVGSRRVVSQPVLQKHLCANDLAKHGVCVTYDVHGSISKDCLAKLKKGKEMMELSDKLKETERECLKKLLLSPFTKSSQDKHRELTAEIQKMEANLVFMKTIAELHKKLSQDDRSKLEELSQLIRRVNSTIFSNGKRADTPRILRHRDHLRKIVRDVVTFLPVVVMSSEQVSTYVPPTHTFGLGILDEASQSDCSAINIMARCTQMLVVGDDQQVSPNRHFLPEERIKELGLSAPNITSKSNLSPESSFFDLIKTAFPSYSILLDEHFRCDPRIIAISNNVCYNSRLVPLRSQTRGVAIIDDDSLVFKDNPVEGENTNMLEAKSKDKSTKGGMTNILEAALKNNVGKGEKSNILEAEKIARYVHDAITTAAETCHSVVPTIGIISLGGEEQLKMIKEHVDKVIGPLRTVYGSWIVDRHRILYGVPAQFQGDERDFVFVSTVYKPKGGKVFPQTDDSYRKMWNVTVTRPRDKLVIVRSYGISHLQNEADVRLKFLSLISDAHVNCNGEHRKLIGPNGPMAFANHFVSRLRRSGYHVRQNGGPIWNKALHVSVREDSASCNALILIENSGESEEHWKQAVSEQLSLERAGRACLRVDYVTLALNFDLAIREVLEFLSKDGGLPDHLVSHVEAQNAIHCVSDGSTRSEPSSLTSGDTENATDAKRPASTLRTSEAKRIRRSTQATIGQRTGGVPTQDSNDQVKSTDWEKELEELNGRKVQHVARLRILKDAEEANRTPNSRKTKDQFIKAIKGMQSDAFVDGKSKAELRTFLEQLNEDPDDGQPEPWTDTDEERLVALRRLHVRSRAKKRKRSDESKADE